MKQFLSQQRVSIDINKDSQVSQKILLGQLGSHGDCLYVTAIAHQIKQDYPNCHLTWAIGSMYRSILDGNPHVDEVWEIPLIEHANLGDAVNFFNNEALERKQRGDFDRVFTTQMEVFRYDGTIRSSTFSGYPNPITVAVSPVLRLSLNEVENVRRFAELHGLSARDNVILIECSVKSDQSFIAPDYALEIAEAIVTRFQKYCVILSSNISISSNHERIIDGSVLSFRENAELTKYCSFLIGGSSGITWISTSDWAKSLPMIQLISPDALWFASVAYDYEYWGLSTESLIEMTPCSPQRVFECFEMIFEEGFEAAKSKFHHQILPNFKGYRQFQYALLLDYQFKNVYRLLDCTARRNGFKTEFLLYLLFNLIKFVIKKATPPILIDIAKSLKQKVQF